MKKEKLVALVVEDSMLIIEQIIGMLEMTDNVKLVIHAANYAEAIKMLIEMRPDVALLDIGLPDKNGIALLQYIKKRHPGIKVIMLTNHATDNYRQVCTRLGAEYFFDKSSDFEKIPEAICAVN